jgi:hypothetical protein
VLLRLTQPYVQTRSIPIHSVEPVATWLPQVTKHKGKSSLGQAMKAKRGSRDAAKESYTINY